MEALLNQVEILNKKHEELAKISGENFNIFRILNVESKEEQTHSAFIAELLNPKGTHDKNDVFLKLFLNQSSDLQLNSESAVVSVEKSAGFINDDYSAGGRIDIAIESKNKAIIIENKIYASDQENQLLRYFNYGSSNYGKNFELFYLTLDGSPPSNWSLGHESEIIFKNISYSTDILNWLRSCYKEAASHPILRETIKQYINLIKHLTNQTMNNKMNNEIVDLLKKSSSNIKSASKIYHSFPLVKEKIKNEFFTYINENIKWDNPIYEDGELTVDFLITQEGGATFYGFVPRIKGEGGIVKSQEFTALAAIIRNIDNSLKQTDWWFWKYPQQNCDLNSFNSELVFSFTNKEAMETYANTLLQECLIYVDQFKQLTKAKGHKNTSIFDNFKKS